MDLEDVWELREENVYPSLFGPVTRGIFPLTADIFATRFGRTDIDARWLFLGVFEFAPTAARRSWLYVTSGYSNPWDAEPKDYDPQGASGAGVEFTFAVTEQGDWAIRTLQTLLAAELLLGIGSPPDARPFSLNDRVALRAPLDGRAECEIKHLIVVEREDGPREFSLPSGIVTLVGFTGITDGEAAFASVHGSPKLISKLGTQGYHPVTDPRRCSIF